MYPCQSDFEISFCYLYLCSLHFEGIGNLKNLTSLGLNRNQLEELPCSIGNLSNLQSLYLSHNHLMLLPKGKSTIKFCIGFIYNFFVISPFLFCAIQ